MSQNIQVLYFIPLVGSYWSNKSAPMQIHRGLHAQSSEFVEDLDL